MQIDPAHGGRAEQSASCWFCPQPSWSTLCLPHQCECSQKRKPRWSIQHKINRTFFSLSFTWDQLVVFFRLAHSPHLEYLAASFTKGSQIDKEKTPCQRGVSKGDPWRHFSARLIDVCQQSPPPHASSLPPLTASLQILYLDQPLPCGSPPLT